MVEGLTEGTRMNSPTHHRIVVAQRGGPEVLHLVEELVPKPAAGEARIAVRAAGVSAFDLMLRSRSFPGFPKLPFTPGVDVVGVIDEVGAGVANLTPGSMVAGITTAAGGGYAESICLPATSLVPVPDGVDPVEAVCVVANYLTAHLAMHRTARVRSGERILVQGAAGGVGTALLELGRLAGLEMYGTASAHNHDFVSSLGATPIDYRSEDVVERIAELTDEGVDVVFDPIGGAGQLWRSYRTLRKGGRMIWFGVAAISRQGVRVIPLSLIMRFGLALLPDGKRAPLMPDAGTVGHRDHAWYFDTLAQLLDYLATGKIHPVVAARFPLAEASRAHELLARGGHRGKVVLQPGA